MTARHPDEVADPVPGGALPLWKSGEIQVRVEACSIFDTGSDWTYYSAVSHREPRFGPLRNDIATACRHAAESAMAGRGRERGEA